MMFNDMLGKPLNIGDKVLKIYTSRRSSFSSSKYYVAGYTSKLVTLARSTNEIGRPSKELVKGVPGNVIKMPDDEPNWPV
jgi:hypothetical protein